MGHTLQDSIFVKVSVSGGVCFLHLPADAVLSSSTCLGDSSVAFQPGTAEDPHPRRNGLESDLPREGGAAGRRERGQAAGVRASRCLAPSLPDMGRGRSPGPPTHVPQSSTEQLAGTLKLDQTRSLLPSSLGYSAGAAASSRAGKPHLGNKLLIGWRGSGAGQSKSSLTLEVRPRSF